MNDYNINIRTDANTTGPTGPTLYYQVLGMGEFFGEFLHRAEAEHLIAALTAPADQPWRAGHLRDTAKKWQEMAAWAAKERRGAEMAARYQAAADRILAVIGGK